MLMGACGRKDRGRTEKVAGGEWPGFVLQPEAIWGAARSIELTPCALGVGGEGI